LPYWPQESRQRNCCMKKSEKKNQPLKNLASEYVQIITKVKMDRGIPCLFAEFNFIV